jgi:hypothetical protein
MRRAAKVLDCTLIYALVPTKKLLEEILDQRRRRIAIADLGMGALLPSSKDSCEWIKAYGQTIKRTQLRLYANHYRR